MATVVELPRLTDTMEEGVIAQWLIAEGDKVKRGQVIAEIETDKATMEFESFDAGYVLKLVASEGDVLALGAAIAVFGKEGEDPEAALREHGGGEAAEKKPESAKKKPEEEEPKSADKEPTSAEKKPKSADKEPKPAEEKPKSAEKKPKSAEKSAEPAAASSKGDRIPASPLARRLAREHDLGLAEISGSGPHGRVIKADVLRAIEDGADRPAAGTPTTAAAGSEADDLGRPYATFEDRPVKLTPMRKTIAKRMAESKREIPHINLTIPIFMDRAAAVRKELNETLDGVKISFNDLLIYAVAKALRIHPRVNAAFAGDGIVEYGDVHVGVAVAIEGGLVVPVVRYADQKSLRRISLDIRDLGKRAKAKSLRLEEMTGSTFTVSNLGMYGIESFTAVINPGEGAILAVGAIADEAVVSGGQVTVRKVMRATLCSDHRVFDGADNARFLATLKKLLEAPLALFAAG